MRITAGAAASAAASAAGDIALEYIGRRGTASPATGSYKQHLVELERLVDEAFGLSVGA